MTKFLTLNADCTVTFPPGEEMERDKRVRWKFVPGAPGDAAVNVNQVIANLCFAVLTRRTKCARAKQHSVERPPAKAHKAFDGIQHAGTSLRCQRSQRF